MQKVEVVQVKEHSYVTVTKYKSCDGSLYKTEEEALERNSLLQSYSLIKTMPLGDDCNSIYYKIFDMSQYLALVVKKNYLPSWIRTNTPKEFPAYFASDDAGSSLMPIKESDIRDLSKSIIDFLESTK